MNNAHIDLIWKNYPSDESPVNEANLNRMVRSINLTDENVHNLDLNKATKDEVAPLIADVQFDESTGTFIFIRKDSVRYEARIWDTKLEQLVESLDFDEDAQQLIITKADGTPIYVDVSAFVKPNEFLNSDTILFSIENGGKVRAIVKEGSIEEKHLRPDYLAEIKVEVSKAQASQRAAAESATESESWAHGGTNTRPNEEVDNARAYAKKAEEYSNVWKGSLLPQGTIPFSQLPSSGNVAGHMYNIRNAFETDSRFEEGAGYSYPAGTNVYWNGNSKWDCLSGTLTKVLTQSEYDSLPQSEKVNGTVYYITDSDNELSTATDTVPGIVIVDSMLSETSKNPVQNKVITERINRVSSDLENSEDRQKEYTDTKIAELINGAPSTLDTLGEIADAMEHGQTVVEALNAAIGTKVDKISGKGLSTNDFTSEEKSKLAGIASNANNYSLPLASSTVRGGAKTGYSKNGKNYPVQLSSEKMYVNVPWVDTTYPFFSKRIDTSFSTRFRTETKGDASTGDYISNIRTDSPGVSYAPQYGAGLAWGSFDTHGYLNVNYFSAHAYLGSGNADKLNWTKELAFTDSNVASSTRASQDSDGNNIVSTYFKKSGGTVSGALTVTGDTTLQGNVRIKKASSGYGSVINIGDGDYIRISEETDNILTVKAKQININSTNANAVYINGQLALRYKKLTQAEYNALGSTKNSDNVLYFITD